MIIGISGKSKSGKNEFYEYFKNLTNNEIEVVDFSFAHILKKISANLFGLNYEDFDDRYFKEEIFVDLSTFAVYHRNEMSVYSDSFSVIYDNDMSSKFIEDWESFLKDELNSDTKPTGVLITMRIFLQFFGTNICRKEINDIWVNSTFVSLNKNKINICTDVRFVNEAQKVLDNNGILIRIERESCNNREYEHISETALDNFNGFTYTIYNNGNLNEFHTEINKLYEKLKNIYYKN